MIVNIFSLWVRKYAIARKFHGMLYCSHIFFLSLKCPSLRCGRVTHLSLDTGRWHRKMKESFIWRHVELSLWTSWLAEDQYQSRLIICNTAKAVTSYHTYAYIVLNLTQSLISLKNCQIILSVWCGPVGGGGDTLATWHREGHRKMMEPFIWRHVDLNVPNTSLAHWMEDQYKSRMIVWRHKFNWSTHDPDMHLKGEFYIKVPRHLWPRLTLLIVYKLDREASVLVLPLMYLWN